MTEDELERALWRGTVTCGCGSRLVTLLGDEPILADLERVIRGAFSSFERLLYVEEDGTCICGVCKHKVAARRMSTAAYDRAKLAERQRGAPDDPL